MIPLRVLIVEDSEPDSLLLSRELWRGGYQVASMRVDTADSMRKALAKDSWDLVIADYSMPKFSGMDALKVLTTSGLDIPFILVTGSIKTELAVQMMNEGAQDFILKNDLLRLVPAVARELRASEIRRRHDEFETSLQLSEERFRKLFTGMSEGFMLCEVVCDDQGAPFDYRFLQVNPAFEDDMGWKSEDVVGKTIRELVPKPDAHTIEWYGLVALTGRPSRFQNYRATTGRWYDEFVYNPEKGKFAVLFVDITERKRSEQREIEVEKEKLNFYRQLLYAATEGKLLITEREEIEKKVGTQTKSWDIKTARDLSKVRKELTDAAQTAGMEGTRIGKFVLGAGEAATNAVKHASGGKASLHTTVDSMVFMVSDKGPGISALELPEVALKRGYSTAGTLGVGYKVMIKMGDRVYLASGSEGTTVAVEMNLLTPTDLFPGENGMDVISGLIK